MKKIFILTALILFYSCNKNNYSRKEDTTNKLYKRAKDFLKLKNPDSAFYYYNLAKNSYQITNDSIGIAKSLTNMSIIQTDKGDYYGGIETSLEAEKYLKGNSEANDLQASNYNNLAIASKYLQNYREAENYYHSALKFAVNKNYKLVIYNNIGDVLIMQKKNRQAIKYLNFAIKTKDSSNYSRALNNLAKAKYLEYKDYNPLPELYKALKIRKKQNDLLGLNSSYATLADYFSVKDKKASLIYAKLMMEKAILNKRPDDQLEALQKIIILDTPNYLEHFHQFQSINDSLQTARNKAKNQFAVVRYDLEEKKAENAVLKTKEAKSEARTLRLLIIILILLAIVILGNLGYRKRKKRLEQEKELEVKNTELKYSKKVHDVVANGIYQVMTKIENQENFDKEKALDELEFVYEKSRDISHDEITSEEKGFNDDLSLLIASFNNTNVKTYIAGNDLDLWSGFRNSTKEEIYQVIRELMVNMKKHSQAERVVFKFKRENNIVFISYSDNGIGISENIIHRRGIQNAESRINSISGEIIFDTKIEKGLKINITVPVS